ncbi:MAG TPA: hypothetical protein VLF94_01400 [Chlamydiales bacterium]|nr:hypothetical protein [Chlamydiales bacterium]
MGIWFERELDSYKQHSKQVLAKEGSRLQVLVGTVALVGMVVGKVEDTPLACTLVFGTTWARPARF